MNKIQKRSFLAVPVFAATFFLSGCGASPSAPSGAPSSMPNNAPTNQVQQTGPQATPVSGNVTVNIQNFAFGPQVLTIKKGSTVTWTNNDSAMHQIKSNTFNSSALSKGQSFSFTFNDAGTFDYSCAIHPSMTGKIVVQ